MLILVTGGSGFIGSHVVDKLVDAGHKVRSLDLRTPLRKDVEFLKGSITSMQAVRSAMAGVNVVYHFAAFSNIDLVKAHPVKTVRANVMGTVNVLEAARLSEHDPELTKPEHAGLATQVARFLEQVSDEAS